MPFRSETAWKRDFDDGPAKFNQKSHGHSYDTIYFYTKTANYYFNKPFRSYTEEDLSKRKLIDDNDGKGRYEWSPIFTYSKKRLEELEKNGELRWIRDKPQLKFYVSKMRGRIVGSVWTDIKRVNGKKEIKEVLP